MERNQNDAAGLRSLLLAVGESGSRLFELEGRMERALAGGDLEELDEIIRLQQPDLMNLERANSARREIETRSGFRGAAFRREAEALGAGEELIPELERLGENLAKLRKINRRNLMILKARSEVVERLISLAGAGAGPATYREDGGRGKTPKRD